MEVALLVKLLSFVLPIVSTVVYVVEVSLETSVTKVVAQPEVSVLVAVDVSFATLYVYLFLLLQAIAIAPKIRDADAMTKINPITLFELYVFITVPPVYLFLLERFYTLQ